MLLHARLARVLKLSCLSSPSTTASCLGVRGNLFHGSCQQETGDSQAWLGTEFFDPELTVEQGDLGVFVGGGQPDYYQGGLSAQVGACSLRRDDGMAAMIAGVVG
jgi:hypothetical protein